MKAGSAGSTPDDASTKKSEPTQLLRDFLREVGEAVANLNTAVVGFDAVEKGYEKPATLDISWNPADRVAAGRKARRFVLEAVLVRAVEALHQFIWATAKLPRFGAVREGWNKNTSGADRLANVLTTTIGAQSYLGVGATLLIHWRNRVVHSRSRAELTPNQKQALRDAAAEIEQKFAGLSVERLLEDFTAGLPTLKDISSLIAMTIRMARAIDQEVGRLSKDDLEALIDHYELRGRIQLIEARTVPEKRHASVERMLQSVAPGLARSYREFYVDSEKAI